MVQAIHRHRTATDHLLHLPEQRPVRRAGQFRASHAEESVCYVRQIEVSPNGHPDTAKQP